MISKTKHLAIFVFAFLMAVWPVLPFLTPIARAVDNPLQDLTFSGMKIAPNSEDSILSLNINDSVLLSDVKLTITNVDGLIPAEDIQYVGIRRIAKVGYNFSDPLTSAGEPTGSGPWVYDISFTDNKPSALDATYQVIIGITPGATLGHSFTASIENTSDVSTMANAEASPAPLGYSLAADQVSTITIGSYASSISGNVVLSDESEFISRDTDFVQASYGGTSHVFLASVSPDGSYSFQLPLGSYYLDYHGYKDYTQLATLEVDINGGPANQADITLTANAYSISGSITAGTIEDLTILYDLKAYKYNNLIDSFPSEPIGFEGTLGEGKISYTLTVPTTGYYSLVGETRNGETYGIYSLQFAGDATKLNITEAETTADAVANLPTDGQDSSPGQGEIAFHPEVSSIVQHYAKVGNAVTLVAEDGQDFGAEQGISEIHLVNNNPPATATFTVINWSSSEINMTVPADMAATSGDIYVWKNSGDDPEDPNDDLQMWGGAFVVYKDKEAVVVGTVVDPTESHAVIAGAQIEAQSKVESGWFNTSAFTDGTFVVGPFKINQPYDITAKPSWGNNSNNYAQSQTQTVSITAEGKYPVSGTLTFTLSVANIIGYVYQTDGTTPVPNVFINIHTSNWSKQSGSSTNNDGKFLAGGLPDGSYQIQLGLPPTDMEGNPLPYSSPSDIAFVLTNQEIASVTGSVTLNDDNSLSISLQTPQIVGKVVDPGGDPVSNVWIQIHTSDWTTSNGSSADANGIFRLGGLTEGTVYTLEANTPPGGQYTAPAPITFTYEGIPLNYTDNPDKVLVTMASPQITGIAQLDAETPVNNASVGIHKFADGIDDWSVNKWSGADMSGRFSIGGLVDGTYKLEANPPWNRPDLLKADDVELTIADGIVTSPACGAGIRTDGEDQCGFVFTMTTATKFIFGKVERANHTPITNARVNANKNGEAGNSSSGTDTESTGLPDGQFKLAVSDGTWRINLNPDTGPGMPPADWIYTQPEAMVDINTNNQNGQACPEEPEETCFPDSTGMTFTVGATNATISGTVYIGATGTTPPSQNSVWINLMNKANMSGGNGIQMNQNGTFSSNVTAGQYEMNISSQAYTTSPNFNSFVNIATGSNTVDGDSTIAGIQPIRLVSKSEFITGIVTDQNGTGLAGIHVNAYKINGSGWADAVTADGTNEAVPLGQYTISVGTGRWGVHPMIDPNSSNAASNYVYSGKSPELDITANETETVDFELQMSDATITGRLVDGEDNIISTIRDGGVWADKDGGFGASTQIRNGQFTLKVVAGTYHVGIGFPPGYSYTAAGQDVNVAAGDTESLTFVVTQANAHIKGNFKDSQGNIITGIYGGVDADDRTGSRQWSQINPVDGSYDLLVPGGKTWYLHVWVDPKTSGQANASTNNFTYSGGEITVANLGSDESRTNHITLTTTDSIISGRITKPNGSASSFAFVYANNRQGNSPGTFDTGTQSNYDGTYSIKVPHGTYNVGVGMSPDMQSSGLLPPSEVQVAATAGRTTTQNFQFTTAKGHIRGTVSLNGSGTPSFIWGWSEKGSNNFTQTDSQGRFNLSVSDKDIWHVGASKEEITENGRRYYNSPQYNVTVGDSATVTQNIVLETTPHDMIGGKSETFDSSEMKVITLEDGTRIEIPSGALAASGDVTVSATPKAETKMNSTARPIGLAYDLSAFDSNGTAIEEFNSTVTITLNYTSEQLTAAGITEDELTVAYFDDSSSLWTSATSFTKDADLNTITITTTHFSQWATVASSVGAPGIASVTTTKANGSYKSGTIIDFKVNYTKAVSVNLTSGRPRITLNDGGYANYLSGSGTKTLTFRYTVATGQNTKDLGYSAVTSLSLRGGTIKNGAKSAINILPSATAFRASHAIVIDTVKPTGTIKINNGSSSTRSSAVTLYLKGTDLTSGIYKIRISNNNKKWTTWKTYTTKYRKWSLTSSKYGGSKKRGTKRTYIQFQDKSGNTSAIKYDTIKLK